MAERLRNEDPPTPPERPSTRARRSALTLLAALPVFFVLVTANSAGYRYGAADQAFYIPAIERALDPAAFPRDAAVVAPQSQWLASDQMFAWMVEYLGIPLPDIFLAGYAITCLVFVIAVTQIGAVLYASTWTTWALLFALTLRHRITATGVNTFEGSFHPRVLVFALGLAAVAALLRLRVRWAVGLLAAGFLIHPTTALWFSLWLAGAGLVFPRGRRWVLTVAVVAILIGVWLLWAGPLAHSMRLMDPVWTAPLATKDYLFPTSDWSVNTWLTNAIAPAVVVLGFVARSRRGLVSLAERSVFVGAIGLLTVFLSSLPFIAARVAIAVQLQTSRILWPIEFLATVYLVWALIEARRPASATVTASSPTTAPARRRAIAVAGVIALAAVCRGAYALRVEHDRPLVARDLPRTAWIDVATWVSRHTPIDAHVLADPGHAWKYGISVRVAARRDVFLEEVKDAAMATYAREVAVRFVERTRALGDFGALTPQRASALATQYDIDYLIADRPFPFPVAYANQQFTLYVLPRRP